ncbi:hypothetical protein AJ80_04842 [Polytolypa hystricis UAMH7299]|uniref:Uncharacterized protein n=1 Tax=Polytolypa hystricis (strain UAMH7299) TaxID=1447883 RepID=A0A2B7Y7C2_POLH7|nr:hypothetical protein AJ80_04842 [Polytolypa hystricis UAMH7299]
MASSVTSISQSAPSLSSNDSAVLQALFDAESKPSTGVKITPSLTTLPHISPSSLSHLQALELSAIQLLESTPTSSLTRETIETAISKLSSIITNEPKYASAYVNRAQALRMLIDFEKQQQQQQEERVDSSVVPQPSSETSTSTSTAQIFADLSQAITLLSHPAQTGISSLHARILANAYTHRAYLLYKAARSSSSPSSSSSSSTTTPPQADLPTHLQTLPAEKLEDMASWDFQAGGRYGNDVARQMGVQTNPYAKMCGAIVREAMRKDIEEWRGFV